MITSNAFDLDIHAPVFLQLIKYQKEDLKKTSNTFLISREQGIRNKHNFLRLVREFNWNNRELDEVLFIINDLNGSTDYLGEVRMIYLPNQAEVKRLLSTHKSSYIKHDI